jgi:hypothetical protein
VKYLKQAQAVLIAMMVIALVLRIILWSIAPLLPYIGGAIILLGCLTWIFSIMWNKSSKL